MTGVEQEKSLHATDQVQADRVSLFTVVSTKSGVMALQISGFPAWWSEKLTPCPSLLKGQSGEMVHNSCFFENSILSE
jgi:hypothetical protein